MRGITTWRIFAINQLTTWMNQNLWALPHLKKSYLSC
uniref:Uncharacterized protein n=1 Tax=Arundo donax TaxID=35708 RepID=A0A0A9E8A5_ARUDO